MKTDLTAAPGAFQMPFTDRFTYAWREGESLERIKDCGGLLALTYWHASAKGVWTHVAACAAVGVFLALPGVAAEVNRLQKVARLNRAVAVLPAELAEIVGRWALLPRGVREKALVLVRSEKD